MSLKASTSIRNKMLVTGSLKSILDGGFIKIYSGAVPADADAAILSAQLLCTISDDGAGLIMNPVAAGGAMTKANDVWSGTNVLGGTATFWRFVKTGDTGTSTTIEDRLQGLAATSGSELVMTSINLSLNAPQNIDYFSIALPA